MYILDTDICIAYLAANKSIENKVAENQDIIFTTTINIAELYFGAYKSERIQQNLVSLEVFIENVNILEFDVEASNHFGKIKANLVKSGKIINDSDIFIASIALSKNYVLATHNIKHFERIEGLKIEDWLA